MKSLFTLSFMLLFTWTAIAQSSKTPTVNLKKVLTLKPSSYESGNGATVVWHSGLKRYFTSRAGNAVYPLDLFSAIGRRVSDEGLKTMFDVRGMWYNTMTKKVCMNGYNETGWASYLLNAKGIPEGVTPIVEGMNQPSENSVGCFDGLKSRVYFLSGTGIFAYNANNGSKIQEEEVFNFSKGINNAYELSLSEFESELPVFYNTVPIFTGIAQQEIGLLNYELNQVDLYNMKTGMRSKVYRFPEGTVCESFLNVAFANGLFFIYDKEKAEWNGYK